MARNRERQRHNRAIKEQMLESKNAERYTDLTPFNAVNDDLKKQFCRTKKEFEELKRRQAQGKG